MPSMGSLGLYVSLDVMGSTEPGSAATAVTGPVYIEGAEPGDLLDIEILDIEADRYGYTTQVPGFGFLRDWSSPIPSR